MPSGPLVTSAKLRDYAAFSDESHTSGSDKYMVIGGVFLRSAVAHKFAERVNAIQADFPHFKSDSLQWKSQSKAKVALYKAVVDEFFLLNSERLIDFNCVTFERSLINHKKHNENDPETGFFKFLFQHHLSHSREFRYGPNCTFRCYHGNMDTGYDLAELKRCLNASAPKRRLTIFQPYKIVEFMPVRRTRCLQIADILIGAVGYVLNGKCESKPDCYRTDLAKYVERHSPVRSLREETQKPDFGFSIWHFPLGT